MQPHNSLLEKRTNPRQSGIKITGTPVWIRNLDHQDTTRSGRSDETGKMCHTDGTHNYMSLYC